MLVPSHYYQQTCGRPDLLETSRRRNKITRPSLLFSPTPWATFSFLKTMRALWIGFLCYGYMLRLHSRVEYTYFQMQNCFSIQGSNHSDGETFVVTSIYTQHVGSRWYTSDFNVKITDFLKSTDRRTKACIPKQTENMSNVCSQRVAACSMSQSVAIHFPTSMGFWSHFCVLF